MKWEYEVIEISEGSFFTGKMKVADFKKSLNELGEQGWELVSITSNKDAGMGNSIAVLKRKAPL